MKESQKHTLTQRWREWPDGSTHLSPAPEELYMSQNTQGQMSAASTDQWAVFSVVGMHCHRCEQAIQKRLATIDGVHEAEVDFNSGQASVLYDHDRVSRPQLIEAIHEAGYQVRE